ncbi:MULTISPECIES: alpha/beta hydrolase [Sphingomonas]|uniref:alpha/beta hydrolase n=1 Tax=Sphingomonas TaxID=13687 RepID=UPI000DEFEEAF|nr:MULTISPECIES: alpha/beta hydrolase [Sphingomonas]
MTEDHDTRPPPATARVAEIAAFVPRAWKAFLPVGPLGPAGGPKCLVLPGFLASDRSTAALRQAFADAGWRTAGWELGLNSGAKADTIRLLRERFEAFSAGEPVLLVGWSLGGVFARELAREVPTDALAVVTLGSPFSGDPHWNNVWRLYELVTRHKVDAPPIERNHAKPPVPTLALWSRRDGIVAPRSAYGLPEERDEAVELDCTHMGFAVSSRGTRAVVAATHAFLTARGLTPP